MPRIITKEDLYKLLDSLVKDFEVIGPQELPNKGIFYQRIMNTEGLYLGDGFTIEPIKKFFLSPSEWLFKEKYKEGNNVLEDIPLPKNKRIVIGVRHCEVRALSLLDKVFDSEYKDSSYINNRKRTTIIGLSCAQPDKYCFCTSMGGSPAETSGMDAVIFATGGSPESVRGEHNRGRIENRFVVEMLTDKGKDIFGSVGKELNESAIKAGESDKEKRRKLLEKKIKVPESLDAVFESDYWNKVSFSCIGCGICTFLCPSCHCFDLVDEERKRLRCYDGCAFSDFTLEASGVNPRPAKKERYRQRVFHKFDYFKKNFGENLCVGCGRCIRHCPVKIDIAEIVANAPTIAKT